MREYLGGVVASIAKRVARLGLVAIITAAASLPGGVCAAGSERYDYDGLGRLVRVISSTGEVTEYQYDPVGNITAVVRGNSAQPPSVTSVTPASLRRGTQVRVTVSGSNLNNASVQPTDRELSLSGITRTTGSIAFNLSASEAAPLGSTGIRVSSAAGASIASVTVRPALPKLEVAPLPIAVPPDGRSAGIDLSLTNPDDVAHTVNLVSTNTAIATVSPASITLQPGQTVARLLVTGKSAGNTELRLTSSTLAPLSVPVFVTAAFEGVNTARAHSVGVVVGTLTAQQPTVDSLLPAPLVGVLRGGMAWLDTAPRSLSQGSSQTLRIMGRALPQGLRLAVEPPAGLSVGEVTLSADGLTASVPISADASAVQGIRRLVLTAGTSRITPAVDGADQLDIVAPAPVVDSVSPIVLAAGSTVASFEVRGRNLQDVTGVQFLGGGVTASSTPQVSLDGTLLMVGVQVASSAAPGPRTVVLQAPGGNSSSTAGVTNTVQVRAEDAEDPSYAHLGAPLVGVQVGTPKVEPAPPALVPAPLVGVAVGSLAFGVQPSSISRTETIELRVSGQQLGGTTSAQLTPGTGLTVGTPRANAQGTEVIIPVTVAADAPLGLRRLDLMAGSSAVRVGSGAGLTVTITPLTPIIESVSPNTAVPSDIPFDFVIRGRNFQAVSGVGFQPSGDISVGDIAINPQATEIRVRVSVSRAAQLGARAVVLSVPNGSTGSVAEPNNTLTITSGNAFYDLSASLVGVQVGTPAAPEPARTEALVPSPIVGVQVGQGAPAPQAAPMLWQAAAVGVTVGPVALRSEPAAIQPGVQSEVVVSGRNLPAGARLKFHPQDVVQSVDGPPVVAADGTAVRQSITGPTEFKALLFKQLRVDVVTADGVEIAAAPASPEGLRIFLVPHLPEVVSLDTIVARQGDTVDLLIRGRYLNDAVRVAADPAVGLEFAPDLSVNAAGTELRVKLYVRTDAPLGSRVIRVFNRLGGSAAEAAPANTFTVFARE